MSATLALLIIAVIFALGDLIAVKTKAVFSMMFVSGLILLVGFWLFLPKTLFEDAQISKFAIAIIPMLMVYMGTLMKLRDLKEEWKTVLLALASITAVYDSGTVNVQAVSTGGVTAAKVQYSLAAV